MTSRDPGSPPVGPPAWVWEALKNIEDKMTGQHQRMREDMNEGFDKLGDRIERNFDKHAAMLAAHASRLDRMEAIQEAEAKVAGVIAAIISLVIGALSLFFKAKGPS